MGVTHAGLARVGDNIRSRAKCDAGLPGHDEIGHPLVGSPDDDEASAIGRRGDNRDRERTRRLVSVRMTEFDVRGVELRIVL